eukprot:SAG31_NODE_100_length_25264_cov_38.715359_9_plen_177_part_00
MLCSFQTQPSRTCRRQQNFNRCKSAQMPKHAALCYTHWRGVRTRQKGWRHGANHVTRRSSRSCRAEFHRRVKDEREPRRTRSNSESASRLRGRRVQMMQFHRKSAYPVHTIVPATNDRPSDSWVWEAAHAIPELTWLGMASLLLRTRDGLQLQHSEAIMGLAGCALWNPSNTSPET